jgi:hypothetical protein
MARLILDVGFQGPGGLVVTIIVARVTFGAAAGDAEMVYRVGNPDMIGITSEPGQWLPIMVAVFLPFPSGYFPRHLLRTLNGLLADGIALEFHLDAAGLGLLTSVDFLTFRLADGHSNAGSHLPPPGVARSADQAQSAGR